MFEIIAVPYVFKMVDFIQDVQDDFVGFDVWTKARDDFAFPGGRGSKGFEL